MDSNNVLSITNNLDKLHEDFNKWNSMSFADKARSDKICMEMYNLTNRGLYNHLHSHIMHGKPVNIKGILNESFDYSSIDRKDLITKIGYIKSLNQDITVAILYPYDPEMINDPTYRQNYKDEFLSVWNRFLGLSHKYKKYSNSYSLCIFGYNVKAMYELIINDLVDTNTSVDDIHITPSRDYLDSNESSLDESLNEILVDKNILELYKFKLQCCIDSDSRAITEGYNLSDKISEVNQCILSNIDKSSLKNVVPYFTLSEYNSIIDCNKDDDLLESYQNDSKYYQMICELYDEYQRDKDDYIAEHSLLALGWNPEVNPRTKMDMVKDRHIKWFNEHKVHLVDLSDYDIESNNKFSTIFESTSYMNRKYKENDCYPVYLVLSYTNTAFGKIIRKVKNSTFTHAGISLDSDLSQILTFMFDDKNNKGFMVESLERYLQVYDNALISVLCIFVNKNTLDKLNDAILYFINNKHKTSYNFKNLLNILRNKAKDNDPENLCMVCSQFVDTILKLADIDLTHKSSNLVTPKDLAELKHPRVFQLYKGLGSKYDEVKVESKIDYLLSDSEIEDILYNDFVSIISESAFNLISHRYRITDNDKANSILQEFYDYIKLK